MSRLTRRTFLQSGATVAAAAVGAPLFTPLRPLFAGTSEDMLFRVHTDSTAPAPDFVYATDDLEDPFRSAIRLTRDGVVVPQEFGDRRFSVHTRWYVKDFGWVWLAADNAGELYSRSDLPSGRTLDLNVEFARSRVSRNRDVRKRYEQDGTVFSPEVINLTEASEELLASCLKAEGRGDKALRSADRALANAMWAGEKIELERAQDIIARRKRADRVWFGCETRQFIWGKSEDTINRFMELFNFATVTHYVWDTWYELFEPKEGYYNWGIKDNIVHWLSQHGITLEGRPLYWPHPSVTPDWLTQKDFDGVRKYLDRHVRDLVLHYGDKVLQWEVVNEMHDWANVHHFSPDQITQLVRLACDTTRATHPGVVRIINNCCPFAEYVARGRQSRADAKRPLRSPRRFVQDLLDAGVEFDVLGIQIYFPQRDLSDIVRLLERFEKFKKPLYITEIGASSNLHAPSATGAVTGNPADPYGWHRHWDEGLQADWLEQVYTLYYSRPSVKAINWYDFSDFRPFIINGGLVREDATTKQSYHRLKQLLASWGALPPQL
ncbi:MAG: endo-1,4-beta-xylanase [Bacteroidetes bacterium]|nr:endo-1,4-beta-xylanase [Bacteroidota bacterium]